MKIMTIVNEQGYIGMDVHAGVTAKERIIIKTADLVLGILPKLIFFLEILIWIEVLCGAYKNTIFDEFNWPVVLFISFILVNVLWYVGEVVYCHYVETLLFTNNGTQLIVQRIHKQQVKHEDIFDIKSLKWTNISKYHIEVSDNENKKTFHTYSRFQKGKALAYMDTLRKDPCHWKEKEK